MNYFQVLKIFLLLAFIGAGGAQAVDNTEKQLTISAQDLLLGGAVVDGTPHSKHTAETQASKAIASAEALKLLEILENPDKRQKAIEHLKAQGGNAPQAVLNTAAHEWWVSLCHWIKRDNLWFAAKAGLKILIILIIYMVLRRLINHFVDYYIQRLPLLHQDNHNQSTTVAIIKTVSPIIRSTIHWLLIILATLLILSELNINIMPIIYSFSVIGLAISIGSQTLVKDLINGVMTLFEGNMAVGDIVTIGAFKGEVESISLRCVHLRHPTGEIQTIPFSEVNYVINHSRGYSIANIEFSVSFQTDLKQVEEALQAAYEHIKNDKYYASFIKGELKKLGISHMDDWNIKVNAVVKTVPDPNKVFVNEFYRLLIPELQKRKVLMEVTPFTANSVPPSS